MYTQKHEFPKGYKQFRVMDLMQERNGLTYTEIIKFAFELSGKYKFDKRANRGYWSGAFQSNSPHRFYGSKVDGWITVLCDKGSDGKYRVNASGLEVLSKLMDKYKGIDASLALGMKKFWEKYKKPLENFGKRNEQKSRRISINDGVVTPAPNFSAQVFNGLKTISPEVKFRGLKLGDKVAYYTKNGNKSGVGFVFSITEFAPGTDIKPMMKVRDSLDTIIGLGIEVHYDSKTDKFMDGIKECEIIKI